METSQTISPFNPGSIILFGSGETSPSGRKVFDQVLRRLPMSPRIALLETPAGFELNSERVIGRVADFITHRLQNYNPQVFSIPARQRGTENSPDNPQVLTRLPDADLIFMGPGSPTYAVRQLRDSLAWQMLLACHSQGAALVLASAAAIAVSAFSLPVYEIYKVGEELHWKAGLDLFGLYGLPLVFIPHWNNQEGGEELDTTRCFMGQKRFARLMEMLPSDLTVLGIDEKTALIMDLQAGECHVAGLGGVTLIHTWHEHEFNTDAAEFDGGGLAEIAEQRQGHVHIYASGESFPLSECCPPVMPVPGLGVPDDVWQAVIQQRQAHLERRSAPLPDAPPSQVLVWVAERQAARLRKDWAAADTLRSQIAELGWQVKDSPEGPQVERI